MMRKTLHSLSVAMLFSTATWVTAVAAEPETEQYKTPKEPWTKISPGGNTGCAHGGEFSFWVREASKDDLLVYFEGGGGCWSAETCQKGSRMYIPAVREEDAPYNKAGIFDFENTENPFKDHSVVFIPSCGGDVFWGDKTQKYAPANTEEPAFDIQHFGFNNASSALKWAYEFSADAGSVTAVGCSAGSVGVRVHTPALVEQYGEKNVTVIGDSMAFVFPGPLPIDTLMGAHRHMPDDLKEAGQFVDGEGISINQLDTAVTNLYTDTLFGFYSGYADPVQERFYMARGGTKDGFRKDFDTHLKDMRDSKENFVTYVSDSPTHCTFREDEFYDISTTDVPLKDWVKDIIQEKKAPNVP